MTRRIDLSFYFCLAGMAVMIGLGPFVTAAFRNSPSWLLVLLASLPVQLVYIAAAIFPARSLEPEIPLRKLFDLKMPDWRTLCLSFSGTAGIYILLGLVTGIWSFLLTLFHVTLPKQPAILLLCGGSPAAVAVLAFIAVFIAPFGEELCFRNIIRKKLEPLCGGRRADLISALFFSIMHLNLQSLPALFLLGLWFNHLYRRSGSLCSNILAHAVFNGITVLIVILVRLQIIPMKLI